MSHRIEKLNSLIKEEVARIIKREVEFSRDVLVTVTKAETSVDATHVNVSISVLPENKEKIILERLKKMIGIIQSLLNRKLIMRFVPKIFFKIDKSTQKIDRMEKIIKELG